MLKRASDALSEPSAPRHDRGDRTYGGPPGVSRVSVHHDGGPSPPIVAIGPERHAAFGAGPCSEQGVTFPHLLAHSPMTTIQLNAVGDAIPRQQTAGQHLRGEAEVALHDGVSASR
jgi:hypothetical protein